MTPEVAAIIPARNESQTVGEVVSVLKDSRAFSDVIVVSDGSVDDTAAVARAAGASVVESTHNRGKGEALLLGLAQTSAPVVAFFDADLLGLTTDHVHQLIDPVVQGSLVMNVSLRDRGRFKTFITRHLPLISGERVLDRRVIETIHPRLLKGYMVEAALNYRCRSAGWRYGSVALSGLSIRRKFEKVSFFRAVLQYLHMFSQVLAAMVLVRLAFVRGMFS